MKQHSSLFQFEEVQLNASADVASFIAETGFEHLPQKAVEKAKRLILDYLGVTLAATTSPVARILKEHLSELGGKPQATIVGFRFKTPCSEAAWANGTLGHVFDYDDNTIELPAAIHTTVTVLPAALSVGEALEVGGGELITAFVLGTEAACKIDRGIKGSGEKGFHGTGTFGTLGATVAAGKLMKLSAEEMEYAIGIAASMAGGLASNFGTMTKPLHAGNASRNGVVAALLAKKGFTSSRGILEKDRGFGQVFGQGLGKQYLKESLGQPWEILEPGIHMKLYPACVIIHAAIDATLKLVEGQNIDSEQVDSVEVRANFDPRGLLFSRPKTVMEARFSPEFCVAIALLEGKATLDEFTEAKVVENRVQKMIEKVHRISDSRGSKPVQMAPTSLKVRMKNGKEYNELVEYPRGSGKNPLTAKEVETKFRSCAKYAFPPEKIDEIIRAISNLEDVKTHQLMSLLRP
jgi:2-methylcitrate dehydratase PrpD